MKRDLQKLYNHFLDSDPSSGTYTFGPIEDDKAVQLYEEYARMSAVEQFLFDKLTLVEKRLFKMHDTILKLIERTKE